MGKDDVLFHAPSAMRLAFERAVADTRYSPLVGRVKARLKTNIGVRFVRRGWTTSKR